ncbi:MAG: response regulator [Verrucomicrobia bacterium]|nr:response regulator [Verrucomicrobiota bacterium]
MKLFGKSETKKPAKSAQSSSPAAPVEGSSPPKKILVVDDDLVIVKTLTLKLEANGYRVLSAHDGSTAVTLVRQENPDIVILDVNFPPEVGMSWDGFKIMEWFQGRATGGRLIPVVIITGEDSIKNRERAIAAGATSFYQKPLDMEELLTGIREILAALAGKSSAKQ